MSDLSEAIKKMPKVELHAHLGASIDNETLLGLYKLKYGEDSIDVKSELYQITNGNSVSLFDSFKKFKYVHDLTTNYAAIKYATVCVIKKSRENNIIYFEMRSTPRCTEEMTRTAYIQALVDGVIQCQIEVPGILVKLLISIDRGQGNKGLDEQMNAIFNAAQKYPSIIKGVDFSGNPEINSFRDFKEVLKNARDNNLKLALHCGESENDDEVLEMLNFGMHRIGHGTFIKETLMGAWDMIKAKNIPIECCLSSNIRCGTVKAFEDHHFYRLRNAGMAALICTDGCGVFDTSLTNELQICANTFGLDMQNLLDLQLLAVTYCFADEPEKLKLAKIIKDFAATVAQLN